MISRTGTRKGKIIGIEQYTIGHEYSYVADGSGIIGTVDIEDIGGHLERIVSIPGTPAPAVIALTLVDQDGMDLLNSNSVLSPTVPDQFTNADILGPIAIAGDLTLGIVDQATANAEGKIIIYISI